MADTDKFKVGDTISWKTPYGITEIGVIEELPDELPMTPRAARNTVLNRVAVKLMRGPVIRVELETLQGLSLLDAIALVARNDDDPKELG